MTNPDTRDGTGGDRYALAKRALTDAEQAWKQASFNYHQVANDTEAAYMDGHGHDDDVQQRFHAADAEYCEALTRVVAAREFAQMLRSQAVPQVDPKAEILASIAEYQNALPATAGLPVAAVPVQPARSTTQRRSAMSDDPTQPEEEVPGNQLAADGDAVIDGITEDDIIKEDGDEKS